MTRKHPLHRLKVTEVRFSRSNDARIVAAPTWAYEQVRWNYRIKPNSVWAGINAIIKRREKERERRIANQNAKVEEEIRQTLKDPNADRESRQAAAFVMRFRADAKERAEERTGAIGGPPDAPNGTWRELRTCVVCGQEFFGQGRIVACTDTCAKIQRDKTRTRGNPKPRRVEHEPRTCDQCDSEFIPRRKDALFCSGKCRTAHHRGRK